MNIRILLLGTGVMILAALVWSGKAEDYVNRNTALSAATSEEVHNGVVPIIAASPHPEEEITPPSEKAKSAESEASPPAVATERVGAQTYFEVTDGCGPYYGGSCLNVRSGPSSASSSVMQLRTGMVLQVGEKVSVGTTTWYKVVFGEWLRYPERVAKNWYVAGDYVKLFNDPGTEILAEGAAASTTKRILVDRSEQMLYAYDGDTLFMKTQVSTGLDLTPTPRGTFHIYKKTPSRYMQGPLPGISDQYYDLPGVPWNLYFTEAGGAIHGAYWHDKFGHQWSHGCVNLPLDMAQKLYDWADLGMPVTVRD